MPWIRHQPTVDCRYGIRHSVECLSGIRLPSDRRSADSRLSLGKVAATCCSYASKNTHTAQHSTTQQHQSHHRTENCTRHTPTPRTQQHQPPQQLKTQDNTIQTTCQHKGSRIPDQQVVCMYIRVHTAHRHKPTSICMFTSRVMCCMPHTCCTLATVACGHQIVPMLHLWEDNRQPPPWPAWQVQW